ncbi:MAG: hypothetical protein PHG18_02910 [Bacilli bacterium]|nr:hypothetical protein [Bacilli bacterium]
MINKNIKLIICIMITGFLLTGCQEKNTDKEKDYDKKDSLQSLFIDRDYDCNKAFEESYYAKLYHTDSNNVKYYSVCLNEITLKFNSNEITLKKALEDNPNIMDEIINKLTQTDLLYDGGTAIYKELGYSNFAYSNMGNTGFTVIKCNAMQGSVTENLPNNKDYYFGDLDLEYEEGYCSN